MQNKIVFFIYLWNIKTANIGNFRTLWVFSYEYFIYLKTLKLLTVAYLKGCTNWKI